MMGWFGRVAIGIAAIGFMMAEADARITHLEITKTEPAFRGESWPAGSRANSTLLIPPTLAFRTSILRPAMRAEWSNI
jgi:hypothetical protein